MNTPTWTIVFAAMGVGLIFGFAAGMWAMRVTREIAEKMVKSILRDMKSEERTR